MCNTFLNIQEHNTHTHTHTLWINVVAEGEQTTYALYVWILDLKFGTTIWEGFGGVAL